MKNIPIKAKNESNSPLFANFLTQSGVFYNFLTRSTSCAKVSYNIIHISTMIFLKNNINWIEGIKINRNITNIIRNVLDNFVPPMIRDQKWFVWLPFKLMFKDKAGIFFTFKEKLNNMSDKDIVDVYIKTKPVHISRETDINTGCLEKIVKQVIGNTVLDIACGSGYLTNILEKKHQVTAVDFVKSEYFKAYNSKTTFVESDAIKLPFENDFFDTVICTHTLEHIRDINQAIRELKRVCKKRLIVVVPKQRPYKYTFDLHIHFFPYEYNLIDLMSRVKIDNKPSKNHAQTIQGDIYYTEDFEN